MARSSEIKTCFVCVNVYCLDGGSQKILQLMKERLAEVGSPVEVKEWVCFGACTIGPNLVMHPEGTWYTNVQEEDIDDVVAHLQGGEKVERLTKRVEPILHELILDILDSEVEV
jgi:(2Fe-2S) ferredoxin